jgi:transcriptional regulator with XRE-family HTH domain
MSVDGADSGKRTGAMLLAARTAAGLELADVARETRVPLRHLQALENDAHDQLPALPYAIGFVKSYARAVGLDPETVAEHFRSETSKGAHVPTSLTLEPLDERRLPSRGLVFVSIGVVVAIIAGLSAWGAGMFDPPTPAIIATAPPPEPEAAPAPQGDQGVALAPATVPGAVAIQSAPGVPIVASGAVVLTAKEDVWVKIYDNATKTTAKIGILKTGESFVVPPVPPGLMLWTGKAGALDVTVGGRKLPPLGGPVEAIRNVSLAGPDLVARANGTSASGGMTASAAPAGSAPAPIATPPAGPKPIATVPGT